MTAHRTVLPERNLDILRTMAVGMVLANHVAIALGERIHTFIPFWIGRVGVIAFFVHTSLVLMSSLERQGTGAGWLSTFYIRRGFRIYPLAIVVVLLTVLLQIPARVPSPDLTRVFAAPDWFTLLSNMALVTNLTHTHNVSVVLWTLPLEVQMYLVFPFCFLLARKSVFATVGVLLLSIPLAFFVPISGLPGVWRLRQLAEFAPCFLCGVLTFALLRHSRMVARLPSWIWWLIVPVTALIVRQLALPISFMPAEWAYAFVIAIAIPLVREVPASFGTRLTAIIAKYSYSIYLVHIPVLWFGLVVCQGVPLALRWGIVAISLVIAPWAFYHLIEAPGITLGKRLVTGPGLRAATAPAP